MAAMLLADMGAEVLRVERKEEAGLGVQRPLECDVTLRSRNAIALDLKDPDDIKRVLKLVSKADALIEGFRPGVMERLGLGPEVCLGINPKLVFGRMTGFGLGQLIFWRKPQRLPYIESYAVLALHR